MKRDLSRPSSTVRNSSDHEAEQETSSHSNQNSASLISPIEIVDLETNGSLKTIFDKVKNTFSPNLSARRTTMQTTPNEKLNEVRRSSITSTTDKDNRHQRLKHQKSVTFAGDATTPRQDELIENDQELLQNAHHLADQILLASVDEAISTQQTSTLQPNVDNDDDDFQRQFYQAIRPRRMSIGYCKDLVYQDLSAEIVAYVLKHALKSLEQEEEQMMSKNEIDNDFIDLK